MRFDAAYNLFGTLVVLPLLVLGLSTDGTTDAAGSTNMSLRTPPDKRIAEGTFEDRAKSVEGKAIIRKSKKGALTLSFENFTLAKTPNPHVYLSSKDNVTMDDISKGVPIKRTLDGAMWHIGALKKVEGSQRYKLSSSVDLARHNSIVIWCEKVNVPLAVAPLDK